MPSGHKNTECTAACVPLFHAVQDGYGWAPSLNSSNVHVFFPGQQSNLFGGREVVKGIKNK
jgi:hypothetical protein